MTLAITEPQVQDGSTFGATSAKWLDIACRQIGLHSNMSSSAPLVAANAGTQLAMQLSDSVVAIYQVPSPAKAPQQPMQIDWVRWLRPVMLLGMLVIGSTYFARAKSGASAAKFGGYGGDMVDQRQLDAVLRAQRTPAQGGAANGYAMRSSERDRYAIGSRTAGIRCL